MSDGFELLFILAKKNFNRFCAVLEKNPTFQNAVKIFKY